MSSLLPSKSFGVNVGGGKCREPVFKVAFYAVFLKTTSPRIYTCRPSSVSKTF